MDKVVTNSFVKSYEQLWPKINLNVTGAWTRVSLPLPHPSTPYLNKGQFENVRNY